MKKELLLMHGQDQRIDCGYVSTARKTAIDLVIVPECFQVRIEQDWATSQGTFQIVHHRCSTTAEKQRPPVYAPVQFEKGNSRRSGQSLDFKAIAVACFPRTGSLEFFIK